MALSATSDAQPGDQKTLVEIIEELDRDNERLRTKLLEFMALMEEAVTAQVAAERRVVELNPTCTRSRRRRPCACCDRSATGTPG